MSTDLPLPHVTVRPETEETTRTRRLPPYHVILENDEDHSFEFVEDVLCKVLGCGSQRAVLLAMEAHTRGRAVIWTGPKEVAELKLEQMQSFHEIRAHDQKKLGALGCYIEPAPGA